jgi:hypothetical protein
MAGTNTPSKWPSSTVSKADATPSAVVPDLIRVGIIPSCLAGPSAMSAKIPQIGEPQSRIAIRFPFGLFSRGSVMGKGEGWPEFASTTAFAPATSTLLSARAGRAAQRADANVANASMRPAEITASSLLRLILNNREARNRASSPMNWRFVQIIDNALDHISLRITRGVSPRRGLNARQNLWASTSAGT